MNLSLVIEKTSEFGQACNSQHSSTLVADLDLGFKRQKCSRDERSALESINRDL